MAIVTIEGFDTKQLLVGEGKWSGIWLNPDHSDVTEGIYQAGALGGYSITATRCGPYLQRNAPPLKWVIGLNVYALETPFAIPLVGIRNTDNSNFSFVVGTQMGRLFAAVNAQYSPTASSDATSGGILTPEGDWLTPDKEPILLPSRWVYVEVMIEPSDVEDGYAAIRVDEELWWEQRNLRTLYGDGKILQIGSNFIWEYDLEYAPVLLDDVYVLDGSGFEYNNFLGTVYVATVLPIADGTHATWTPNTGTAAYACVDDPGPHDGDNTYIYTDINGAMQSFKMAPLEVANIHCVQLTAVASKIRLAAGWIGLYTYQEGKFEKTPMFAVKRGYKAYSKVFTHNPWGDKWSAHDLSDVEFGVYAQVDWKAEE